MPDPRRGTAKDVTLDRANQSPVPLASATPASGPAPLTVAFAGLATDPDGSIGRLRLDVWGRRYVVGGQSDPPVRQRR